MKHLEKVELYRYLKSRNTKIFLAVMLTLFIGISQVMIYQEKQYTINIIDDLDVEKTEVHKGHTIAHIEKQAKVPESKAEAKAQNAYWTKIDNVVQGLQSAYRNPGLNHLIFNDYLRNYYTTILEGYEKGFNITIVKLHNQDTNYLKREILAMEAAYSGKIPYNRTPYTLNLMNYWNKLFSNEYLLVILMLIALINVPLFSQENESGVYKQMYTQPFKRKDLIKVKIKGSLLYSFMIFMIPFMIASLFVAIVYGVGYFNYPVVTNIYTLTSVPWISYRLETMFIAFVLIMKFILFIGLMVLVIFTCHFVSIYSGSSSTTLATMTILMVFTYMVGQFIPNNNVVKIFWLFGYYRTDDVLTASISTSLLFYIISTGILCAVLNHFSIKYLVNKDMTGQVRE